MMRQAILNLIVGTLSEIKPQPVDVSESLFGWKNNFTPRDVAYVLLQLEAQFGIEIESLVRFIDGEKCDYTVNTLVDAVFAQKGTT